MDMPKFSLRDLFWSMSLLGTGSGIYAYGLLHGAGADWFRPVLLGFVSPLIGAGIGALFQRKAAGLALGIAAMVVLIVVFGVFFGPYSNDFIRAATP
jgi:hypothetical protein